MFVHAFTFVYVILLLTDVGVMISLDTYKYDM